MIDWSLESVTYMCFGVGATWFITSCFVDDIKEEGRFLALRAGGICFILIAIMLMATLMDEQEKEDYKEEMQQCLIDMAPEMEAAPARRWCEESLED